MTFSVTIFASIGFSRKKSASFSPTQLSTIDFTSDETNLSFVCDENFGSGVFTETTAINPSLQSSPDAVAPFLELPAR